MTTATENCPVCSQRTTNLDEHIESSKDCLRAIEMGLGGGVVGVEHPMRGLPMTLLRSAPYGAPECNVFSSVEQVTIVGRRYTPGAEVFPLPDHSQVFAPTEKAPAAVLVYRPGFDGGGPLVHVEPYDAPDDSAETGGPQMFGGTYAETSDSRLAAMVGFYGAVAVHDRRETWDQYDRASV